MSRLLAYLKSTTQPRHDQLETVSYAKEIMSRQIDRHAYFQLLQKTTIIYQILEPMVEDYISKNQPVKFKPFVSHRLVDLQKDLTFFKKNTAKQRPTTPPFKIDSLADLVGILYVLEGARLGGKVIVKALQKNPALATISAFHFYQQKGIDTRERWLNFRTLADESITDEKGLENAAQSAERTFTFFYQIHAAELR